MTKKFDIKKYQGKPRVYSAVAGAQGIVRLWYWDSDNGQYKPPTRGKAYEARRRVAGVRQKQSFDTLEQARQWLTSAGASPAEPPQQAEQLQVQGMLFSQLVTEWRARHYPGIAESTQGAYDKVVRLHFGSLMNLSIYELTPARIDQWIDELKDPKGFAMQSKIRVRFDHELGVLSNALRYYQSYHDDPRFQFPVKERHNEAVKLNKPRLPKAKDLIEEEFFKFRENLSKGRYGQQMAALATVQYYQALRISEAAALHWEDVSLNMAAPKLSRLKVVRTIYWPRRKGMQSVVRAGFKNSEANDGVKEHPLFAQAFHALLALHTAGACGLIFQVDGSHFEYRQIQWAYDKAFKAAGLPYSATHVMRHGGCRRVYNATGDLSIAQQHLGNKSMQTVTVYAKRSASALTGVAHAEWDALEVGRNGPQTQATV